MLGLTAQERAELDAAARDARQGRQWRRYRAVLLLGEARPEAVAATLGCGRASIYAWAAAWRREGIAGLRERPRGGRPPRLAGEGAAALDALVATDPQASGQHATGWTVPLLRADLARAGYAVGERTIRRALHALGWRWKRPKYVLGRPDPDYEVKRGR
jgi:putative transposase